MKISVRSRQRAVKVNLRWLRKLARCAAEEIRANWLDVAAPLASLKQVEVTLITDAAIAQVHQQFLGLEGPTDVISFDHGEILIGVETAGENAVRFRSSIDQEIALYIIHGLLHIDGYEDDTAAEAAKMRQTQKDVLSKCLRELRGEKSELSSPPC